MQGEIPDKYLAVSILNLEGNESVHPLLHDAPKAALEIQIENTGNICNRQKFVSQPYSYTINSTIQSPLPIIMVLAQ